MFTNTKFCADKEIEQRTGCAMDEFHPTLQTAIKARHLSKK